MSMSKVVVPNNFHYASIDQKFNTQLANIRNLVAHKISENHEFNDAEFKSLISEIEYTEFCIDPNTKTRFTQLDVDLTHEPLAADIGIQ